MEDAHNLINFGPTNPIQILNQHEIFWRFCMCPSNDTFDKNKKILKKVLGLNSKDKKSTRDKANISNPKVNRGCAPLTANRTSADCVQISLGPSIPYIPLGVYCTGRFNATNPISHPWRGDMRFSKYKFGRILCCCHCSVVCNMMTYFRPWYNGTMMCHDLLYHDIQREAGYLEEKYIYYIYDENLFNTGRCTCPLYFWLSIII